MAVSCDPETTRQSTVWWRFENEPAAQKVPVRVALENKWSAHFCHIYLDLAPCDFYFFPKGKKPERYLRPRKTYLKKSVQRAAIYMGLIFAGGTQQDTRMPPYVNLPLSSKSRNPLLGSRTAVPYDN
ncbi:hypothetical protein EVAR_9411_1 [Eumeta japonica]|uniref:Uncharacterized protein n=1 Tax=Eumeta variegata TaxID=151549 RepID=A0A4C1UCU2_EUMVA|nr:hypothetical protein EVAR_9411_1 [Eumeta japonica]